MKREVLPAASPVLPPRTSLLRRQSEDGEGAVNEEVAAGEGGENGVDEEKEMAPAVTILERKWKKLGVVEEVVEREKDVAVEQGE